ECQLTREIRRRRVEEISERRERRNGDPVEREEYADCVHEEDDVDAEPAARTNPQPAPHSRASTRRSNTVPTMPNAATKRKSSMLNAALVPKSSPWKPVR